MDRSCLSSVVGSIVATYVWLCEAFASHLGVPHAGEDSAIMESPEHPNASREYPPRFYMPGFGYHYADEGTSDGALTSNLAPPRWAVCEYLVHEVERQVGDIADPDLKELLEDHHLQALLERPRGEIFEAASRNLCWSLPEQDGKKELSLNVLLAVEALFFDRPQLDLPPPVPRSQVTHADDTVSVHAGRDSGCGGDQTFFSSDSDTGMSVHLPLSDWAKAVTGHSTQSSVEGLSTEDSSNASNDTPPDAFEVSPDPPEAPEGESMEMRDAESVEVPEEAPTEETSSVLNATETENGVVESPRCACACGLLKALKRRVKRGRARHNA